MDIAIIIDSLFDDASEWESFHDVILELTDISYSKETLKDMFRCLPKHVQHIAFEWGLSDTVFRNEAYSYINDEIERTTAELKQRNKT
jgi:hypothetical protein